MFIDIFNTDQKYDIIYTDPPWQQQKGNKRTCRPNQNRSLDYKTMLLSEIKSLHEQIFMNLCTEKHNVFMWTIDKYLFEAERIMRELGYELHARIVWNKENGTAPAFTLRFSHEYLLWFYKKGQMLKPTESQRGMYTTVLTEKSKKHSQKPKVAYEMLDVLFPNTRKIEIFARSHISGWDCWGNEVT